MTVPPPSVTSLRGLLLFAVFAVLAPNTSAFLCDIGRRNLSLVVSNQEDVNTNFGGCTEIEGSIYIATNYTGPFHLANVTSLAGGIYQETDYYAAEDIRESAPFLTSIECPNLNSTYEIRINNASLLTTISFPSLLTIKYGLALEAIGTASVDFPSLTAAHAHVYVSGNTSSLNFPLLKSIDGDLRVARNPVISPWDEYVLTIDTAHYPPMDISFPALQNASSVFLAGNISSLSMPQLSVIAKEGVRVFQYGNPFNLSLPILSNSSYISLIGTIGTTSLPCLVSVDKFEINSVNPLDVVIPPPLAEISIMLRLMGNITGISMPSITTIGTVSIKSEIDLDCSSVAATYESRSGGFYCDVPEHIPKNMTPLKLGLGLGLGIPVFLCIVLGVVFWRKRVARDDLLKNGPPGSERIQSSDGRSNVKN